VGYLCTVVELQNVSIVFTKISTYETLYVRVCIFALVTRHANRVFFFRVIVLSFLFNPSCKSGTCCWIFPLETPPPPGDPNGGGVYLLIVVVRKRKANWIGHILRRNCLLQRFTEGKIQGVIEVTGRQGRRRRKLLDDLKERRGYSHLKEEALERTIWRAHFGRGFGPVVRQTTK
jgi:hypothetical protein